MLHTQDQNILDLVTAMEITYSFMVSADELKNHPVVHDIVEQILKQTMDCGCSIRGNMRRNFGELSFILSPPSMIRLPNSALHSQISGRSLSMALVLSRTASAIDMIGAYLQPFYLSHDFHAVRNQVLKPADMDEYNYITC